MKKLLLIAFALQLACGIASAQTESNTYVSLNGKFYIEYPSDWLQVPHAVVDQYLSSRNAGRPLFDYDAVFASKDSDPYYSGSYLIMNLELVGDLAENQIDSVLQELTANFRQGIKYFPVSNFMADIETNRPIYDKESKTVYIYSKIVKDKTSIKNSLIILKFYEFGIATFYCYGIGDDFDNDKKIFANIVASLKTENFKSKLPKEHVKVANIEPIEKNYDDSHSEKYNSSNVAIYVALGVVLLVVLRRRKKKKNS